MIKINIPESKNIFNLTNEDYRELLIKNSKKEFEERSKLEKNTFKGNLRQHLYDFGYQIKTSEMKRDFYLNNRLTKIERKNMLDIFDILKWSAIRDKLAFPFAVLGVGTSSYSDKYFFRLKKYLKENGFDKEDTIFEKAVCYGEQFVDFKDYLTYLNFCTKHNVNAPFDEQIKPFPKNIFLKIEQKNRFLILFKKSKKYSK